MALLGFLLVPSGSWAQAAPRIIEAIDPSRLVTLRGNTHPLAQAQYDQGAAPADLALNGMMLILKRSADQQAALDALIASQQDATSSDYHHWLTPAQFGQQFGPAPQDVQTIAGWLASQGFHVDRIANGGGAIQFSGTAGQVAAAFHTEIHRYLVNGQSHWANASDPQIPEALAPVVAGVFSLNDFRSQPAYVGLTHGNYGGPARPTLNVGSGVHALAPGDIATIYNANPLYSLSPAITGTGQTIAVVERSDINPQDVADFRNLFLPGATGSVTTIENGQDAGIPDSGDQFEATLDAEWAGALAPGATVDVVITASTAVYDGAYASAFYAVDYDLAPILSMSFTTCEAGLGTTGNEEVEDMWEQAAAEGITVVVAAGDSGSAGCDAAGDATAIDGLQVSGLASTPFNIAVGGTEFDDSANPSQYWSTTSSPNYASALGYIPEAVWNESNEEVDGENSGIVGGGGGISSVYSEPYWQPAGKSTRALPDIALAAAAIHDPYAICVNDVTEGDCEPSEPGGSFTFYAAGGTSFGTPLFAGAMALVEQEVNATQGMPGYVLYQLAAAQTQAGTSCNASGEPQASCTFHDVTAGSNAVPCTAGSENCIPSSDSTPACINGVAYCLSGYAAATGYDLGSGIGSLNVDNLVTNWSSITRAPSSTTLSPATGITGTHGSPINFTIAVTPAGSSSLVPSGDVALVAQSGSQQYSIAGATLNASGVYTASGITDFPGGTYQVFARYAGDANFSSSTSPLANATVAPENTYTFVVPYVTEGGETVSTTSISYGTDLYVFVAVGGTSCGDNVANAGCDGSPHGTVTLSLNGCVSSLPLNDYGEAVFGPCPDAVVGLSGVGAAYTGDGSLTGSQTFNSSTASTVELSVTQAQPQMTLTVGGASGGPYSGTATLTTSSFGIAMGGTVTFLANGSPIGSPVNITPILPSGSQGNGATASFSGVSLPAGGYTFTATYSGNTDYAAATSNSVALGTTEGFTLSVTPATGQTITPGQSASYSVQVTSAGGFTGAVSLTCTGLPSEATCAFASNPVTPPANGSTTTTLTVTTTADSRLPPGGGHDPGWPLGPLAALAYLACLAAVRFGGSRRRRLAPAALLGATLLLLACGGGGGGGGGGSTGGSSNAGTPAGSYTLIIGGSASGFTSQTASVSLTVN